MRICLVHGPAALAAYWQSLGHEVLVTRPEGLYHDLPGELDRAGFEPDLVVQVERLTARTLLSGLESLSCRKVFWSVDTHLNHFWHVPYGRLFDLVATTQRAWIPRLQREGLPGAAWLPWFAPRRPFVPHDQRDQAMAFVGRVTPERPARRWFAAFLAKRYGVRPVDGLAPVEMFALHERTRIIPNESICGEINFRLFEAAGCGCLAVTQNVSDEIGELFDPGTQVEVYDNVAHLADILDSHLRHPGPAAIMAKAAWERVQREHLVEHRAARLLDLALDPTLDPALGAEQRAAVGKEARAWFGLAVFVLWESGRLAMADQALVDLLAGLPESGSVCGPRVLAARIRALAMLGRDTDLDGLLARVSSDMQGAEPEVLAACSLACLHRDRFDAAKVFWYAAQGKAAAEKPESPAHLYRLWARLFWRAGLRRRQGTAFDEDRQVPSTAMDCLLKGLCADPGDLATYERLDAATAGVFGAEPGRLGFLSHLALHRPQDWRTHFELGMTNLRAFRMEEGIKDLLMSRDLAETEQAMKHFRLLLSGRDSGGCIAKALQRAGG